MRLSTQGPTRTAAAAALVTAALLTGIASVGIAQDKTTPAPKAAPRPALSVNVIAPQSVSLAQQVEAGGSVFAWQEASVGAEVNGWRLAEVRVNVGDGVRKGQELARFVVEMAQAEIAQTEAMVAEAQSALAEAGANARRARDLQASGALSQQEIDRFFAAERAAQARLAAAQATARMQQIRLTQTRVLAPDAGVISARSATVGAVVPAGQELFRLIRQGRLEWRAEVHAAELAPLKPGQTVQVSASGGPPLTGRLRMIAPNVDPATRNALVYVDLPADALARGAARAGMYARGRFDIGSSQAQTLPQSAVLLRDGFSLVFTVGADSRVREVRVATGRRVGERVEITGGLAADARVVAAGGAFLADGDLVKVVAANPAATAPAAPASATKARP